MQIIRGLALKHLKGDVFGGATAAMVALPLALAFGVASGVGPIAGLYGAIAVGFFAAIFGGTPTQVSGPTGPMTVVVAVIYGFTHAVHVDTSAALAIEELFERTESGGQRVYISGLEGEALRTLNGLEVLANVPEDRRFAHRVDAIDAAVAAVSLEEAAAPG